MISVAIAAMLLQQASEPPAASIKAAPSRPLAAVAEPAPPLDPARLAAAKRVVEAVWPIGTLARMYASGAGVEAADATFPGLLGMAGGDPHFAERMRIMRRLLAAEFQPIAASREPFIRAALAEAYARRFDAEQLRAAAAFFATPAGSAIAAETHLITLDPSVVRLMTPSFQDSIRIMASVAKKLEEATKHLPPPPKRERGGEPEGGSTR